MKKLLFAIPFLFSVSLAAQAAVYQVDTEASSIAWKATKVTGAHNGEIRIQSGAVVFEDGALAGGSTVIDMTSITVLDIKDPENNQKLTDHLKSDDFFGVATHPTAELEILQAESDENGKYNLVGAFTIKGITQELPFKATINRESDRVTARAAIVLDRSLFNVRYGSGSFFENLGDRLIHDDFTLYIDIVAIAE